MADLVSGRFPQSNVYPFLFGNNVVNSSYPARTNAEYTGFVNTDGVVWTSGVITAVPVPVDPGTVVSKINILVGNTAASLPTHSFGALYTSASVPALLGQSTDGTSVAAFAASAVTSFTLTTPYQVKATDCTGGYLYVAFSQTATTVSTGLVVSVPTVNQYAYVTGGPAYLALTSGSAVGATATATLASPSAKALAPIVFLN